MTRLVSASLLIALAGAALAQPSSTAADPLAASYKLEASKDVAGAVRAMRLAVEATPNAYFPRVRLAYLDALAGDQAGAADAYRAAAQLAPGAIEPLLGEQLALVTLARWDDAEQVGRQLVRLDPENYLARSRLAWTLYNRRDYRGAAQLYAAVVAAYPSDADLRAGLGWSLLALGRRADAAAAFREVLAMVPAHPGATKGLAAALR